MITLRKGITLSPCIAALSIYVPIGRWSRTNVVSIEQVILSHLNHLHLNLCSFYWAIVVLLISVGVILSWYIYTKKKVKHHIQVVLLISVGVILSWYIYTKKKVKHPHVFLKWQMIRQVSRDYWPDNLKNAMVTC
jgi:uncharacterized membrane protein (UPF0136 family)